MTTCFCTVLRFLGDVSQPARGLLCVLHVVPPLHVASFDSIGATSIRNCLLVRIYLSNGTFFFFFKSTFVYRNGNQMVLINAWDAGPRITVGSPSL